MSTQYVGILVDQIVFKRIPRGNTKIEMIAFYEEGGKMYEVTPCFFRLKDIAPDASHIKAYVKTDHKYRLLRIPTPKVIHNRSGSINESARKRINLLVRKGIKVFNGYNGGIGKWGIHKLLIRQSSIKNHLPHTVKGTISSLREMMKRHSTLLIKPNRSSLGIGIKKLQKDGDRWKLSYNKNDSIRFQKSLPEKLKQVLRNRSYHIQQQIPLATYNNRPFDIRVSVQRNHTGNWQVTGMVGKVAANGHYVSNVHQGGTVYTLETIFQSYPSLSVDKVKKEIEGLSIRIASHLSKHLPHLADVGLDVGITKEGFPYFIECNRRDLRYSFREGNMWNVWKSTYTNPMGYARYMLNHKHLKSEILISDQFEILNSLQQEDKDEL